jgi:[ribosomal protein S18]-alanine N-acetyltransferase
MKQTVSEADIEIAWIRDEDPPFVVKLSRRRFGTAGMSPRNVYNYLGTPNCIPHVLYVRGRPKGYLFYQLVNKSIVIDEIAVAELRQGYGRRLVLNLIHSLKRLRRRKILVMVKERNLAAQLFFKKLGFRWYHTLESEQDEATYAMKYVRLEK